MGECTKDYAAANKDIMQSDVLLSNKLYTSISKLIGLPSEVQSNLKQKELDTTHGIRERSRVRKDLKIEQNKHEAHQSLFATLYGYIAETVKLGRSEGVEVDPDEIMEDWKNYFEANKFTESINPISVQQSAYLLRSMQSRVKRIIKMRQNIEKAFNKNNKHHRNVLLARLKPGTIAMGLDKFGIIGNVMHKMVMLSDITHQLSAPFVRRMNTSYDDFHAEIKQKLGNNQLNLNNGSYTGIEVKSRAGRNFKIVGEELINGKRKYIAYMEETDPDSNDTFWGDELKTVPVESIISSSEEMQSELANKMVYELTNDILRGQTRRIIPSKVPFAIMEEIVDIEHANDIAKSDRMRLERIRNWLKGLRRMNLERPDNEAPRKPQGLHKTNDNEGNTVWWTMLKQGEGTRKNPFKNKDADGEVYNAYIVEIHTTKNEYIDFWEESKNPILHEKFLDPKYAQSVLTNGKESGWIRGEKEQYFGKLKSGANQKDFVDWKLITKEHTPTWGIDAMYGEISDSILEPTLSKLGEKKNIGLFGSVLGLRRLLEDVARNANGEFTKNNNEIQLLYTQWKKLKSNAGKSAEEVLSDFGSFLATNDIQQTSWLDYGGNIRSLNSTFKTKGENYFPDMYTKFDAVQMISDVIDRLDSRLNQLSKKKGSEEYRIISEDLKHFTEMRAMMATRNMPESRQQAFLESARARGAKHRRSWTTAERRRKDEMVLPDYINQLFSTVQRNNTIAEMLKALIKLDSLEGVMPNDVKDVVKNRAMIAFNNPRASAKGFIKGKEYGYEKTAERLNSLPSILRLGRTWDPASAERLIKFMTTLPTMRYLGATAALGNRTQIMNMITEHGWHYWRKARKEYSSNKDRWDEVIGDTGVLNILNMFSEIMMHGKSPRWSDMGFIPGTLVPSKKLLNIPRLLSKGRDKFINDPNKEIDEFLNAMQKQVHTKETKIKMKDLGKVSKKMKAAMYDLLQEPTDKKQMDVDHMKALIKEMIPEIAEDRLKLMVSWKLSWWGDTEGVGGGKSLFTFTESEKSLRRESAIMALLVAEAKGILGTATGADDMSIYKTPVAIKIARDAVYATQFGMTPVYLGEGFNGLGRALWQYKQFPSQQINHDYQVLRRFTEGNKNFFNGMYRTMSAFKKIMMGKSKETWERNPITGEGLPSTTDHEAIAMGRLILTRIIASSWGAFVSTMPLIRGMVRGLGVSNTSINLMRSMENPALGFTFRVGLWFSLMMYGDPDDKEKKARDNMISAWELLFLPVLLGSIVRDLRRSSETLEELNL
ncbi:hypothetical protein ACFL4H_00320 [Candidatus Neomarinimicrobiota bacterium]